MEKFFQMKKLILLVISLVLIALVFTIILGVVRFLHDVCVDSDKDGYDDCNFGEAGDDGKLLDCNDNNLLINAGAQEICDTRDNDCNTLVDENNVCGGEGTSRCDEYEYWEEVSNDLPYPGMDCDSGPSKTIGVIFFVPKDDSGEYIADQEDVERDVADLNQVFNPHGIHFLLDKITFIDADSEVFFEVVKDNYAKGDLNILYIDQRFSSCSFPWSNLISRPNKGEGLPHLCQISISKSQTMYRTVIVHEVGHYFGLLHTQERFMPDDGNWEINGPHWVDPELDCYTNGDYICDTSYDCSGYCEEALGCSGIIIPPGIKKRTTPSIPNGIGSYIIDPECPSDYLPPLDNFMSTYAYSLHTQITPEQGARARYFLKFRIDNELNKNQLIPR